MTNSTSNPEIDKSSPDVGKSTSEPQPQDSYIKLAMRNMVRKGGRSLRHFFLTTIGLLAVLIGLAYLTKP